MQGRNDKHSAHTSILTPHCARRRVLEPRSHRTGQIGSRQATQPDTAAGAEGMFWRKIIGTIASALVLTILVIVIMRMT